MPNWKRRHRRAGHDQLHFPAEHVDLELLHRGTGLYFGLVLLRQWAGILIGEEYKIYVDVPKQSDHLPF